MALHVQVTTWASVAVGREVGLRRMQGRYMNAGHVVVGHTMDCGPESHHWIRCTILTSLPLGSRPENALIMKLSSSR